MKVRLEDGSYLVAVGVGGSVHVKTLIQAEKIEKSTRDAVIWVIALAVIIPACIITYMVFR